MIQIQCKEKTKKISNYFLLLLISYAIISHPSIFLFTDSSQLFTRRNRSKACWAHDARHAMGFPEPFIQECWTDADWNPRLLLPIGIFWASNNLLHPRAIGCRGFLTLHHTSTEGIHNSHSHNNFIFEIKFKIPLQEGTSWINFGSVTH